MRFDAPTVLIAVMFAAGVLATLVMVAESFL